MASVIQFRRDTASAWTSANPTLASGEIGFETDTNKFKIGNGSTAWSSLSYSSMPSSAFDEGDFTAKGQLLGASASATTGILAAGTNDYVLTADSTQTLGVKWASPTTGDITGVTAGTNIGGGGSSGTVTVILAIDAAVEAGSSGSGVDVTFHSATAGDYMMWDASEEKLIIEGTNAATALEVTAGNVVIGDGTLTIGSDGAGEDVVFYSDTAGDNLTWDSSAKKLIITGTDSSTALDVADGNVSITDGLTVSGTTALSTTGFGDATVSKAMMKDYSETTNAIGATSATQDIDLEDGNVVTATLSVATTTFTFSNPIASDDSTSFTLILTQDGTGSRAVTWPASVDWAGGTAPTLTTTATTGVDILTFMTVNAGTTWYGFVAGQAMA